MSKFLTVKETAELLRVNPMTIYRYINAEKITAYKIGKDYRIKREDFNKFLKKIKKDKK